MSYTMYTPLNVWLDPASVTDVVAYIQTYLSENTIYSETEIETIIHDYLIAHPELIGGVQSVNGKTGTVVLSASDINTEDNVSIESVLASLSSQISSIAASVATNTTNITNLTGRVTTAETDISNLKSSLNYADINVALTEYFKRFCIYGCSHSGNGTYNLTLLSRTTMGKRICLPFSITINGLNNCKIGIQIFDASGNFISAQSWYTTLTVPANTYFQFIIDSANSNIDLFEIVINESVTNIAIIDNALNLYNASINIPPMIKQQMTPLTILNVSPQSFDYDGDNNRLICYGNASYFFSVNLTTGQTSVLSKTMDCGHGNSSCYNKNTQKFYVFGWDTPYITPINITSTPVKETAINTGLTGYLSGAIDFDNNIAYIFQRDTTPDTDAYYNFIAFDLTNNTVISTSKTTIQMNAIQDCKFKDGFIFANWGATKSHFSCFDNTGRCVYSYENTTQTYGEPEGLAFVDDSIFISAYDGTKLQTFKLVNSGSLFT